MEVTRKMNNDIMMLWWFVIKTEMTVWCVDITSRLWINVEDIRNQDNFSDGHNSKVGETRLLLGRKL